jgi:predicted PurR-regulated permease PerM
LNPLVDFFQRLYEKYAGKRAEKTKKPGRGSFFRLGGEKKPRAFKRRTAGTCMTYIFIVSLIAGIIIAAYFQFDGANKKMFAEGIGTGMTVGFDKTVNDIGDFYAKLRLELKERGVPEGLQDTLSRLVEELTGFIGRLSAGVVPMIGAVSGRLLDFLMAMVMAFYFLRDKEAIKSRSLELYELFMPRRVKNGVMSALKALHSIFSGYIIGQLTDAVIMAVLLSVGLSLVGIDFAVVIGVFSGLMNIIPYFGAVSGFVLSVAVALISGEYMKAVFAAVVIIVLQQIDGMFLVPRIVGKNVELSPVMVITALTVGGSVFGFKGIIFAVPLFAVLRAFALKIIGMVKRRGY